MHTPADRNGNERGIAYRSKMNELGLTCEVMQIEGKGREIEEIGCEGALKLLASDQLSSDTAITIATVTNGDMIRMQGYTGTFTEQTGIGAAWATLEEDVLRQRVKTDVTATRGQFDIMTIGLFKTPIWGSNGLLVALGDLSAE